MALRLFPRVKGHSRKSLRRFNLQIFGRDFLADIYAASREVGVRPFLMWGTLLGCVREGGLMTHDTDLDVALRQADYVRKDALIAAMLGRGYVLVFDIPYKFRFARPGILLHIDVDVFYPWRGSAVCSASFADGTVAAQIFAGNAFETLKEIRFLGDLDVLVPHSAEEILAAVYGAWRTPAPDYSSRNDVGTRLTVDPGDPPCMAPVRQEA